MSKQLTDEAKAALEGIADAAESIIAAQESVGESWEPTASLRIVRNESHRGRPERLQQGWYSRDTGKHEWRDVPIVDE